MFKKSIKPILILTFILWVVYALLHICFHTPFSPDSWVYYDLGQTFFSDFYRTSVFRHYQTNLPSDINCAFPPLFPFLIAIFSKIPSIDIYSTLIINFSVFFLSAFVLCKISFILYKNHLLGLLLSISLLANPDFLDEVIGGRSIPLAVFLQILILYTYLKDKNLSPRTLFFIGFLSGLSFLCRYDFLLAALAIGFIYTITLFKKSLIYWISLFITILPWLIFNYITFGSPFVTDNSRAFALVRFSNIIEYIPAEELGPTIWQEPILWIQAHFYKLFYITNLAHSVIYRNPMWIILFLCWIISYIFILITQKKNSIKIDIKNPLIWIFLGLIGTFYLAGFPDYRYWAGVLLFSEIYFLFYLTRNISPHLLNIIILILILISLFKVDFTCFSPQKWGRFKRSYTYWTKLTPEEERICRFIRQNSDKPIFIYDEIHYVWRFATINKLPAMPPPFNKTRINYGRFYKDYPFDYVLIKDQNIPIISKYIELQKTEIPNLYKVNSLRTEPITSP